MTLQDLIRLVIRWWFVVLLLVVAGTVIGYFVEESRTATYESEGRVVIGPSLDQPGNIIESTGALSRGTLGQTLAQVITGSEVRRSAESDTGGNFGSDYDVDSVVIPESNVVEVSVTGPSSENAAALAQAVMEQTEEAFEDLYPVYDVVLLDVPEASSSPISPNPELGAMIGAATGSAIALLVAVALGDRPGRQGRVRRPEGDPDHGDDDLTPDGPRRPASDRDDGAGPPQVESPQVESRSSAPEPAPGGPIDVDGGHSPTRGYAAPNGGGRTRHSQWALPGIGSSTGLTEDPLDDLSRVDAIADIPAWLRDLEDGDADPTRAR